MSCSRGVKGDCREREGLLLRNHYPIGKFTILILLVNVALGATACRFGPARAGAAETAPVGVSRGVLEGAGQEPYHTPLAGEAGQASFLGYPVEIPPLDRGHLTSLTLGAALLEPKQGDTSVEPMAALYLRRVGSTSRSRDTISIFVNDLEYDNCWGAFELVSRFENFTLPVAEMQLAHGADVKSTSVVWGDAFGSLGPGLRIPVAPFEVDNDLRIQLLGRAGFFYAMRNSDTGANQVVPPDTLLYGANLRVRYDNMRRNLLELPHHGFATGFDLNYLVRDSWRDLEGLGTSSGNREYFQAQGYLVGAAGIPGLSERNRVLLSLYGGTTAGDRGDRYNAFHINGGPFPSEADDIPRPHYTGIIFDDILATRYAMVSAGYRRELTFFLYLSLLGSYIWADRARVQDAGQVVFKETTSLSSTVSLDCAFFWKSSLYLAYVWDSGIIRSDRAGNGVLLTWNKLF